MTRAIYANGWSLSRHAQLRMDQMGLSAPTLFRAIDQAVLAYPGRPDSGPAEIRVFEQLAVVINPDDRIVITVLWHGCDHREWTPPRPPEHGRRLRQTADSDAPADPAGTGVHSQT